MNLSCFERLWIYGKLNGRGPFRQRIEIGVGMNTLMTYLPFKT